MKKGKIAIFVFFLMLCTIVFSGCTKKIDSSKVILPDDFTFSITWGVYGISSYDSETKTLVKTTDATHPEDYITTLELSEDVLKDIYIKLTKEIDIFSYSDKYNPFPYESTPTQTIMISVKADGKSKTVTCKNIAFGEPEDAIGGKGKRFIEKTDEITSILMNTEEWKGLPDYEFGYD